MGNEDIHIIENDPLIIVDKFPYVKKKRIVDIKKSNTTDEINQKKKIERIYFLTHFHSDHYGNINKNFKEDVFTSTTTKKLLTNILGLEEKYVHNLQINKTYYLFNFELIFIDANHCPGAVIIFIEFSNGIKILHTGDFRCSNVQIFLIRKILSFKNPQTKKERRIQLEEFEEIEKLRTLEKICFNKKEKNNSCDDYRIVEKSDRHINESGNTDIKKEYIILNNKKFDLCQVFEQFHIYKSRKFILSIEEFRLVYLNNIEKLLNDLKNRTNEFYVYENIESNNFFHYFIFIELSLYFNQNEQEILLFFKNEKLNTQHVVLKADNVKEVRFLLKLCKKEKSKIYYNILQNREWQKSLMEQTEEKQTEEKQTEEKQTEEEQTEEEQIEEEQTKGNYNFWPVDKEQLKQQNFLKKTKNLEIENQNEKNEMIKNGISDESLNNKINEEEITNIPTKKKKGIKKEKPNIKSKEEEIENCITTIYLDTTYVLSKNNLFAPQMYLINYIVYICKRKIEADLNFKCTSYETENNSIESLLKNEKENYSEGENTEEEKWKIKERVKENIIEKKRKTLFLFGTYNIGKEKIYLTLAEACNLKIYYKNPKKKKIMKTFLNEPYILKKITDNKLEAQIHVVDINYSYIFPKLEKKKFKSLLDEEIEKEFSSFYYIIPTGWTKNYFFYEKDNITIILLPYSEHSNKDEIIYFLKSIKPCEIVPTVFDNENKKIKILKMLNPYLNLKMAAYNLLKMKNSIKSTKHMISKQFIKKEKERAMQKIKQNKMKKYHNYIPKADKIICDKNQRKISSFITFISRDNINKKTVDC